MVETWHAQVSLHFFFAFSFVSWASEVSGHWRDALRLQIASVLPIAVHATLAIMKPAFSHLLRKACLLMAFVLLIASCGSCADNPTPIADTPTAISDSGIEPPAFAVASTVIQSNVATPAAPEIPDLPPAKAAATGLRHTCALHEDGSVSCWGNNWLGQLGNGVEPPDFEDPSFDPSEIEMGIVLPVAVEEITDSTAIDAGFSHTCALRSNGRVSCWGDNSLGQLGNGESGYNALSIVPVAVTGITDAIKIAAGGHNTCALHGDGSISCWGNNESRQLGDSELSDSFTVNEDTDYQYEFVFSASPVKIGGIDDAVDVDIGRSHICAVHEDGTISCWGHISLNLFGGSSAEPIKAEGIEDVIAVTTGESHTCVLHKAGTVSCWGGGSTSDVPESLLEGVTNAISIDAGFSHTCALRNDMTVLCWGDNGSGQLGNGEKYFGPDDFGMYFNELVQVVGITDAVGIATGGELSCAIHQDGTVSCWGRNWHGEIGNGTTDNYSNTPGQVKNITNATAVSAGNGHACALHDDATISCWGANEIGQLGNGQSGQGKNSAVPVKVQDITDAAAIATGGSSIYGRSCALHQDGAVSCWGNNAVGQLGNGNSGKGEYSFVPTKVQGITNAISISASIGYYLGHSCALLDDNTISCWGMNGSGQLGTGQSAEGNISPIPAAVQGIADATAISTGEQHSCALHEDGTISCWGDNFGGKLGNFGTTDEHSALPVQVDGITRATQVAAGEEHSCALHEDGTISCWGNMEAGRLGNGSSPWLPQKVIGLGG